MKNILILVIAIGISFSFAHAGDSAFCDDPKNWEQFEVMVKKYPDDQPLQILHALKTGLCMKIQQNSISATEAINLFNVMVDNMANLRGIVEEQEGKTNL